MWYRYRHLFDGALSVPLHGRLHVDKLADQSSVSSPLQGERLLCLVTTPPSLLIECEHVPASISCPSQARPVGPPVSYRLVFLCGHWRTTAIAGVQLESFGFLVRELTGRLEGSLTGSLTAKGAASPHGVASSFVDR